MFGKKELNLIESHVTKISNLEAKRMFHLYGLLRNIPRVPRISTLVSEAAPYIPVKLWHNDIADLKGMVTYYV